MQVLENLGWDGLQHSEWKILESIQELLQPFAEYTTLCSEEEYTTISSTVPIIMEIKYHLEGMTKKTGVARPSEKLRDELIKRFDKYINP